MVRGQKLTPNATSNPLLGFFKDERFMRVIANRVILEENGDALSELHAHQDNLLSRVKSSVKEMQTAMERSNSLLTAVALKTGVTEVDGEDL